MNSDAIKKGHKELKGWKQEFCVDELVSSKLKLKEKTKGSDEDERR